MKRYKYRIIKNLSFLIISVILCFALIGCDVVGGTDSNKNESVKDGVKTTETESSGVGNAPTQAPVNSVKENPNPLITEDMWGDVPDAKTASAVFESYEKIEITDCRNKAEYRRVQMSSNNWILKNKEGKTLFCKGGVLYGDMPYYCPVSPNGTLKEEEQYIYDGGWLFVDNSAQIVYYPADTNDSDFDISVDVSVNGEYMIWSFDDKNGIFAGIMKTREYLRYMRHVDLIREYNVYMKGGKNVEKVVVTEETIEVYGTDAVYDTINALTATPPRIVFN